MDKYYEQIKEFVCNNPSIIKDHKSFEDFPILKGECLYVFDFTTIEIVYAKGFQHVLGYDDNQITREFFFNNIHPDDVDIVKRIIRAAVSYCIEYPNSDSNELLSLKYRRRKKDGSYIKIFTQAYMYEKFEDGRISRGVERLIDISFLDNTEIVYWNFKADNLIESDFNKQVYKIYKDFFTKREIEIIFEIEKGLSNKQIAMHLNVSYHTIKTHRKNIYNKANCHYQNELILFCKSIGVL